MEEFEENTNLLNKIAKISLQPQQWKQVFEFLGKEYLNNYGVTTQELLATGILQNMDNLEKIFEESKKINKQTDIFFQIKEFWSQICFEVNHFN